VQALKGLEVLNKNNEWIGITAIPGSLGCECGRHAAKTFDQRRYEVHHTPRGQPASRKMGYLKRYSIPFFLHPVGKMPLNALSKVVSLRMHPKAFEDITAGDYLRTTTG